MKTEEHKIITYNLDMAASGKEFYEVLNGFTKNFYSLFYPSLKELINEFKNSPEGTEVIPRSEKEYFYELLSIGVYVGIYREYSNSTSGWKTHLLETLYNLRRENKSVKAEVDYLRGKLAPLLLLKKETGKRFTSIIEFSKLVAWLKATGEYREEARRLDQWVKFFDTRRNFFEVFFNTISAMAEEFKKEAKRELGEYVPNLGDYLVEQAPLKYGEEDYVFCSRRETEYFLAMVGAELMNLAFRENFEKTETKALLLPACMRNDPAKCKGEKVSLDMVCTGCTKECNINKYRVLGEELGFEVHIIPHSSDFSKWLGEYAAGKNIGVIGVACILNLITGGLEMRELGVPAQCVFLDYCGCNAHWDENGIPTDISEQQLRKILGDEISKENRFAV